MSGQTVGEGDVPFPFRLFCRKEDTSVWTRHRTGPALFFVIAGIAAPTRERDSQPKSPTYAFLRNGDVWVSSGGIRRQVTRLDDVMDFAISADGRTLVLERWLKDPREIAQIHPPPQGVKWYDHNILQVEPLEPGRGVSLRILEGNTKLKSTCGTVLAMTGDPTMTKQFPAAVRDVLTWQPTTGGPYREFACSSDRMTIVGVEEASEQVLRTGNPPQRELLRGGRYSNFFYDVSPNGRYVAYSPHEFVAGELCIVKGDASTSCAPVAAESGRISVSDFGEVLFESSLNQGCSYKDALHASPVPRPGYDKGDACYALFYWRESGGNPVQMEFLGGQPHWISPSVASALIEWGKHKQAKGTSPFR